MNTRCGSIGVYLAVMLLGRPVAGSAAAEVTRAAIRGDGTLLVNGAPVFPVGVRTEKAEDLAQIAECGFNLVLGSGEWGDEHYAEARKHGLLIMAGHYVWATFRGTDTNINLGVRGDAVVRNLLAHAKDQRGRTIQEALVAFDHLPGVIGWSTGDEPEAKLIELVEAGYEVIKSFNPRHIVAPIVCDRQWNAHFRNASDVLLFDNYPLRGTYDKKYLTSINETNRRLRRAVVAMQGKSVWYLAPMYPGSYWSQIPEEGITLGDQRLAVYAGLIAGVKGVIFYHWGLLDLTWTAGEDGKRTKLGVAAETVEQRLDIMRSLAAELHTLGSIICDGRPNDEPDIRWVAPGRNGPGPQFTRAIEYDGKQYVLLLNLLDVPIEAVVFGPDPAHNFRAYDAQVFLGGHDLSTSVEERGEPRIRVGPRGAGVIALSRRPIIR